MYIKVRTIPGSKKEEIKELKGNRFEIYLKEKAERGEANQRLLEILRKYFNEPNIKIINGAHHPIKLLKIGE